MLTMKHVESLGVIAQVLDEINLPGSAELVRGIINRISPSVVSVDKPAHLTPEEVDAVRQQSNYFGPVYGWAHYIRPDAVLARERGALFVLESRWVNGQRVEAAVATRGALPIINKAQADLAAFFGEENFDILLKKWNTECADTNKHKPGWFTAEDK